MADPVSATLLVATAVGGGISAFGQYSGGQAQKQYYDFLARNAMQEANIARLKAGRDVMAGEQEAQKYGIQTAQALGGTITRAGAGNIATGTGSTARVYMSQRAAGLEEQATARQTAAERAYGERVEAAGKVAGAGADVFAGARAVTAGDISAFGTMVSTVGSVAGKWYDLSQLGGGAGVTNTPTPTYPLQGPVTPGFLEEG